MLKNHSHIEYIYTLKIHWNIIFKFLFISDFPKEKKIEDFCLGLIFAKFTLLIINIILL